MNYMVDHYGTQFFGHQEYLREESAVDTLLMNENDAKGDDRQYQEINNTTATTTATAIANANATTIFDRDSK